MESDTSVVNSGRMGSNKRKLKQENCSLQLTTVKEGNRLPTRIAKSLTSLLLSNKLLSLYAPSFFP